MGDRLTEITMRAFRGVPDELRLELPGECSLVVVGDNGTGKSSIADALEFFFFGSIAYLSREGRGIVHHAGSASERTAVHIATTGAFGGTATLSEGVDEARRAARSENFILRGRALVDFVDMSKGQKWQHLFDILGLGEIEHLRQDLQQARNALEGDLGSARGLQEAASLTLQERCPDPSRDSLFAAIGSSCKGAGISEPVSLEVALQQDWAASFASREAAVRRTVRLTALVDGLKSPPPFPHRRLVETWNRVVGSMKGSDRSQLSLMSSADSVLRQQGESTLVPFAARTSIMNCWSIVFVTFSLTWTSQLGLWTQRIADCGVSLGNYERVGSIGQH